MIIRMHPFTSISLLLLSMTAFASNSPEWLNNVEVSAAVGQSWLRSGNTNMTYATTQEDTDAVTSVSNSVAWQVGIGYSLFKEQLSQRTFFNRLLIELNLYQTNGTLTGDVWVNQNPADNNDYTFRAPVTSTRLMLDIKPNLMTWHGVSAYPIMGLGMAWNKIAYYETPVNPGDVSYFSLGTHTTSHFASEIGAGVSANITDHLRATIEYLYVNLGDATPANTSSTFINPDTPPTFSLHDQSLTAGLSWNFG